MADSLSEIVRLRRGAGVRNRGGRDCLNGNLEGGTFEKVIHILGLGLVRRCILDLMVF